MKSTITASTFLALVGTSAAFTVAPATVGNQVSSSSSSLAAFGKKKAQAVAVPTQAPAFRDELIGALDPIGFFDPLGFADKANDNILRQYREAELTHGRVAMLAVIGFLVGEQVEGSSFLFDAQISGPAISHLAQVPPAFWVFLTIAIGTVEQYRATVGWVEPDQAPIDQPGLLRADYIPGDIGFDPLGLKPDDDDDFRTMQTKELQNGRLAMLAAAGFMAQELVDGKGILDHFTS